MRASRITFGLLVALAALVVASVAAAGPGDRGTVPPGEGGPIFSCGKSGTTIASHGIYTLHPCMSNQTSFYGHGDSEQCWAAGAYGYVVHVTQTYPTQYYIRWEGRACMDGTTTWSNPWSYNEYRYSELRIKNHSVYYAINQWRL
jgi:hypothetical protein